MAGDDQGPTLQTASPSWFKLNVKLCNSIAVYHNATKFWTCHDNAAVAVLFLQQAPEYN